MLVSKKETHWYILTLLTSILLTVEKINEHFMMIILKLKHTSRLDSVTVDYNFGYIAVVPVCLSLRPEMPFCYVTVQGWALRYPLCS